MAWLSWRLLALLGLAFSGDWLAERLLTGLPPWWGGLVGATLALTGLALHDAWRGARLLRWMRSERDQPAPPAWGLWGELGDRIERLQHQAERAPAQEREKLQQFLSAIEASPNGVLLLDAGHHIVWANAMAGEHLSIDPKRDLGQAITNLVRAPLFVAYLYSSEHASGLEFSNPRSRGTLWVLLRPYGQGHSLLLTQDITEGRRMDAMRRDFVANVSHEIRTPLTVLSGFVESLQQLDLSAHERQGALLHMQQQTQRMQALVADLLTLARLESERSPSLDDWHALDGLVQRALADAQVLSGGRHAFQVDLPEGVKWAGTDTELYSAVANLLGNAVRYTPEGGQIGVRWVLRPDGRGALEVSDDGVGIAAQHLPRLAERFYRVDSSRSRDTGGTGLGLAIVKHVMQRHGGELQIRSQPGVGSTFSLLLPALRVRHRPMPVAERRA
jgi:two-component system, OmpR family, phosphate regulon sensor histidine kinase PhoR